jgi:DHA2 family metal-tetracycline-proton antiporter-like MFS transporter
MELRERLTGREQKLVLFILALSSFMGSLDATIVNISLPAIAESFRVPINTVSWVAMSYLLVLSGFLLVFGRLGDMKGFRKIFLLGFTVFTLGSFLCGFAFSIEALIGFRLIQGIGAAALEAIGPAMVVIYLPKEMRGKALGILATVVSLGIAAGPIIGGLLTQYVSWQWIFLINVPIGICAIIMGMKCIPADNVTKKPGLFDYYGAILFFFALASFLWPVNEGLTLGWTSPAILGSFGISAVLWILFIIRETRCQDPLCDFGLFRNKNFLAATLAAGFAGLLLAIPAVALMIFGPLSGALSDRFGSRGLATISALFAVVTYFLISMYTQNTSILYIVLTLLCVGVALGVFFPPNMNQILGQSKKDEEGAGSSIMTTMKNVGETVGIALMGTIAIFSVVHNTGFDPKTPAADIPMGILVEGFDVAVLAAAGIVILAVILSAIAKDNPGTR